MSDTPLLRVPLCGQEAQLADLYLQTFQCQPTRLEQLKGAGSNRRYYRLGAVGRPTAIGVIGTSARENCAFLGMASAFARQQLPVPQVYAHSADEMCYLQEDLGTLSLFDFLHHGRESGGRYNTDEEAMLHRVVAQLPAFHLRADLPEVYRLSFPMPSMDERSVRFDLNYFKYCFLKLSGLEFDELALEDDFDRLCHRLLSIQPCGFQYRDFQARNVMLTDGQPRFIDFQGGRRGPLHYDVASFLWQASARYSHELRQRLLSTYLEALSALTAVDAAQFRSDLDQMVLFRCLQVLGAYGYRGLWEGKSHFVESIAPGLRNLCQAASVPSCDEFPYLRSLASRLSDRFCPPADSHTAQLLAQDEQRYLQQASATSAQPLVVDVWSFSYKKGIPADPSGNGGGYVFDCRSTHNPGRFAEYRQLTGLDAPVRTFLEEDGELLRFLRHVDALADFHVRRFLQRGFTHLQFAFGCTGGQHRSVYCAQHLAERLHKEFGVEVHLHHREQHIESILKATPSQK